MRAPAVDEGLDYHRTECLSKLLAGRVLVPQPAAAPTSRHPAAVARRPCSPPLLAAPVMALGYRYLSAEGDGSGRVPGDGDDTDYCALPPSAAASAQPNRRWSASQMIS